MSVIIRGEGRKVPLFHIFSLFACMYKVTSFLPSGPPMILPMMEREFGCQEEGTRHCRKWGREHWQSISNPYVHSEIESPVEAQASDSSCVRPPFCSYLAVCIARGLDDMGLTG